MYRCELDGLWLEDENIQRCQHCKKLFCTPHMIEHDNYLTTTYRDLPRRLGRGKA